jgi:hypothetical protein
MGGRGVCRPSEKLTATSLSVSDGTVNAPIEADADVDLAAFVCAEEYFLCSSRKLRAVAVLALAADSRRSFSSRWAAR